MISKLTILITLLTTLSVLSQTDKELVQKSFYNYKNAVLTDDGVNAVKFVDSITIKYYSRILNNVKTADSLEIDSMEVFDKLTVLSLRHRYNKSVLIDFNPRDLFIYEVNNGMGKKNTMMNATIGEITVMDKFSKAEWIVDDKKTPYFFNFYLENKVWKIDITNYFSLENKSLEKLIKESGESGESENNFILNQLELLTGKKMEDYVWNSYE